MTRLRALFTASLAPLTLAAAFAATATPAAAWCGPGGCWGHHHHRWGGPAAAGIVGGLALGALAASTAAARPAYAPDTCLVRQRVYDDYGNYLGKRRVRVAC